MTTDSDHCLSADEVLALACGRRIQDAERMRRHIEVCESCRRAVAIAAREVSTHGTGSSEPGVRGTSSLAPGETVGDRYRIERSVGRGGMGEVYAAWDARLERQVALKVMRRSGPDAQHDAMIEESRAMAKLRHANVVAVYDAGSDGGIPYVVMELVPGSTLRQWWLRAKRTRGEILGRFVEAGRGLAAAHDAGLVHRDFKPDNVLVDANDRAQVTDFGLARFRGPTQDEPPAEHRVAGTPGYVAPEVAAGAVADARGDVYAFAVSLHEGLTGSRTYDAQTRRRHPRWLTRVLDRCLAPEPERRPAHARALVELLQRGARRARSARVAVVTVALFGVAAATVAATRPSPCPAERVAATMPWTHDGLEAFSNSVAQAGYGGSTDALTSSLADFGRQWEAQWLDACEATHVRATQSSEQLDRRLTCLTQQRRYASSLMSNAWPEGRGVADAVAGLPQPSTCADAGQRRTVPLPHDPIQRAAAKRAMDRIVNGKVLSYRTSMSEALTEIRAGLAVARASGHDPTIAEALIVEATMSRRFAPARSAALAEEALLKSLRGRDDERAGHAWIELAWSATLDGRYDDAERAVERAEAMLLPMEPGPFLTAKLASIRGSIARHRGEFETAVTWLREAWTVSRKEHGDEDARALIHALNLATALAHGGHAPEALELSEHVVQAVDGTLPRGHQLELHARMTVGIAQHELGQYAEGLVTSEQLLERMADADAHAAFVANVLHNKGAALMELGRLDEAVEAYGAAIESIGSDPQSTALWRYYVNLGEAHWRADRVSEALETWHLASRLGRAVAPNHPFLLEVEQWIRDAEAKVAVAPGE